MFAVQPELSGELRALLRNAVRQQGSQRWAAQCPHCYRPEAKLGQYSIPCLLYALSTMAMTNKGMLIGRLICVCTHRQLQCHLQSKQHLL